MGRFWGGCACKFTCSIRTLEERETEALKEALLHFRFNRTHTAKALGISIRTLRNWMHKHQLQLSDIEKASGFNYIGAVPVKCSVCQTDFVIGSRHFHSTESKLFYCSGDCFSQVEDQGMAVKCRHCEAKLTVTRQAYLAKANGRFFCGKECIKEFNRAGDRRKFPLPK